MTNKRWTATIKACAKQGVKRVQVAHVEEIEELQEIVEASYRWGELEEIVIRYNR